MSIRAIIAKYKKYPPILPHSHQKQPCPRHGYFHRKPTGRISRIRDRHRTHPDLPVRQLRCECAGLHIRNHRSRIELEERARIITWAISSVAAASRGSTKPYLRGVKGSQVVIKDNLEKIQKNRVRDQAGDRRHRGVDPGPRTAEIRRRVVRRSHRRRRGRGPAQRRHPGHGQQTRFQSRRYFPRKWSGSNGWP